MLLPMGKEKCDTRDPIAAISDGATNDEKSTKNKTEQPTVTEQNDVKTATNTEKTPNKPNKHSGTTNGSETKAVNDNSGENSDNSNSVISHSVTDDKQTASAEIESTKEQPIFKISIVPLEKLLAKPEKDDINAKKPKQTGRPVRTTRNINSSIIELTDSEDSDVDAESDDESEKKQAAEVSNGKRTTRSTLNNNRADNKTNEDPIKRSINNRNSRAQARACRALSAPRNSRSRSRSRSNSVSSNHKSSKRNGNDINNRSSSRKSSCSSISTHKSSRRSSVKNVQEQFKINSSTISTALRSLLDDQTESAAVKPSRSQPTIQLRHCMVRVKRIQLPAVEINNTAKQTKSEKRRKMSTDAEAEEATTSTVAAKRHCRTENDDDSDYEESLAAAADDQESDEQKFDGEAESNSSDSEVMPQRRKRNFAENQKKSSDNEASSNNDSSDFEPEDKKKKKRRRIKKDSSAESDGDDEKNKNKRKHIRKIIKTKDLDMTTKEAAKEEEDRRKRIEERQKLYNRIFEKSESVEIDKLVLDFDEESQKALLQVDKGLLKKLKPHQVEGVKFMWDACFETLKDTEEKPGSGCILAHCMGLGKTLQVVTLSHTLLINTRRTGVERVLIISPLSTVNNWAREFVNWMKYANRRDIEVYDISRYKDKPTRIFKLSEWFDEGGVCILGYDMYRILANEKAKGLRKKQREQLQQALVDPGPDLVVCDEGHLLKNEKTSISKAVTRMRTKRRIVLTGTPLQNNLKEYYCMIQFVKPNLLGTYKEYMNRFVNPISNGQYTDSTDRDLRLMKHRSHILHKLLEGCIQRRDYSVLAPYLPPKHEYVVYTTLSDLQQQLYEYYMTTHRDQSSSDICGKGARLFQDFQDLRRIWTHPMNLRVNSDNVIAKRLLSNDDSDIEGFICDETEDEEVASNSSDTSESFKSDASMSLGAGVSKAKKHKTRNGTRNNAMESGDSDMELPNENAQKDDPSEWWKPFVKDPELNNINHSPKLLILMRLLQECEAIGDKLLVFSQSLQSLDVIEHFLSLIDSNSKGYEFEGDVANIKGCWTPAKDYFRLDGSCSVEQRESMCKTFNNVANLRARLFLISTRAGGLGINLVAANRVVIFDVSWNPSHDTQSIFRVYRFGQEKPCYIYRLIAMGTMEQKVYERQVAKQAMAKRVIDEQQISRHYNQTDLMELYTYELKPSVEREMPILPKDRLFAELLTEHEKYIFKYHEHDSLLEQEEHENLSDEERKSAWAEYEAEKTRTVQTAQYISYERGTFGTQFGNASGSVTSNKIFGFRSDILLQLLNMKICQDRPELTQIQVVQVVPAYLQQLYNEMNNGDPTMYKALLQLHTTMVHPSGMYMNPLLYANQNPSAAGYNQASTTAGQQPAVPATSAAPQTTGFDPDKVYEID